MPGSLPGRQRLIFEGPGQGSTLFERQIADREAVVTPVVDHLCSRPKVDPDRIAITRCSKGMKARR
jgi:hypothetical protein